MQHDQASIAWFELDLAIQRLTVAAPGNPALVQLTGVYHNLLRRWSDA